MFIYLEKGGKEQYSFAEIVEGSLRQEQIIQSWCKKCDKYQQHVSRYLWMLQFSVMRSSGLAKLCE